MPGGLGEHLAGHTSTMTTDDLVAEVLAWAREHDDDATEGGARRLVEAIRGA